jgi:hypothetical protein
MAAGLSIVLKSMFVIVAPDLSREQAPFSS